MTQISIIQKSDITDVGRFKPDFFLPNYLVLEIKGTR